MSEFDASVNSYRLWYGSLATRLRPSAITLPNHLELIMNRITQYTLSTVTSTAVAAFALVSPVQAAPDKALDQMMDSCIQHFVTNHLADYQGKVTVAKSDKTFGTRGASSYLASTPHYVTVTAIVQPGDVPLAAATCRIGRDGSVISMKTMPLAALKKLQRESVVVAKN
jgi:hypothetical protein